MDSNKVTPENKTDRNLRSGAGKKVVIRADGEREHAKAPIAGERRARTADKSVLVVDDALISHVSSSKNEVSEIVIEDGKINKIQIGKKPVSAPVSQKRGESARRQLSREKREHERVKLKRAKNVARLRSKAGLSAAPGRAVVKTTSERRGYVAPTRPVSRATRTPSRNARPIEPSPLIELKDRAAAGASRLVRGAAGFVKNGFRKNRRLALAITLAAALIAVGTPIVIIAASSGGPDDSAPVAGRAADAVTYSALANVEGDGGADPASAVMGILPAATPEPTPDQTPVPSPTPEPTPVWLMEGYRGPEIASLQARLMELDYMDNDEPTEYFGPQTNFAVQLFQRKHNLEIDGIVGEETLALIYDENAKHYTVSLGADGVDVQEIQKRLKELGYLKAGATGHFGTDTEKAVAAFQKRNGLTADGNVGNNTREKLYADNARKAASESTAKKSTSSSSSTKSNSSTKKKTTAGTPGDASSLISYAQTLLGSPYVRGGKGPDKFDCSGFVYYCLNQTGNSIGYMTSGGWANASRFGYVSSPDELAAGDIVCVKGHVGIYMGGGKIIDASSGEGKVRICSLSNWWRKNWICGRRVL